MIRKAFSNYSLIIKNAGYLSVLEILKLIMPFIALPYLIRIIGGEKYGMIAFIQTIISYFSVFINFGLDISAVRSVALARNNKVMLSEIVSSILSIKLVLWFISLGLLIIAYFLHPFIRENILLVCFAFLACIADVLFPVWYYQGIEKMKYITFIRFFSILFYTCSIFLFIKKQDDYIYIPLFQSLGLI
ncbi:MAG: oligosaccharide flippase family protein, partial [Tannerellaceae bacterium]|nr:oligosaccharide flippase family protein [Tannerellaceae bacterium]